MINEKALSHLFSIQGQSRVNRQSKKIRGSGSGSHPEEQAISSREISDLIPRSGSDIEKKAWHGLRAEPIRQGVFPLNQPLAVGMPPSSPQGRVHGVLVKGNLPASLFNERHGWMSRSLLLRQSAAGIGIRKQGLGRGVSAGWRLGGVAADSAVEIECGAGGSPVARTGRGWPGHRARTSLDRSPTGAGWCARPAGSYRS